MRALLLLLAVLAVSANTQDRDSGASQKPATGTVAGRVIAADTGRPVARATVTAIRATDMKQAGVAATDEAGRFHFSALPPGAYTFSADKRGAFVSGRYGQSDPTLPGQLVRVVADSAQTIEIALVRGGVIAGRILDEAGDPLPLAPVVVARPQGTRPGPSVTSSIWVVNNNRLPGNLVDGSRTDDRGEYRVFGLAPGEYILYAMPPGTPQDVRPVPIYFPGVTDPTQAMRLTVAAGQELGDISFTARNIPVVKITGVVTTSEGVPQANVALSLHVEESEGGGTVAHIGNTRQDGAFSLDAVPGRYVLRGRRPQIPSANPAETQPDLSGSQPIWVGESDISGVFLKLTQGATLKGRFIFEGSRAPTRLDRFNVIVESGAPGAVTVARAEQDGSFVLRGIEAGRRRVIASTEAGFFVKNVILNGHDVADLPIEFRDESVIGDLAITVTNTTAPLTVNIASSATKVSTTVAVFNADPARWHSRGATAVAVGDTGESVRVDTLPPGNYLAVALANVAVRSLDLRDNTLLERLKPLAREVTLIEGAITTVRLEPVTLRR